MIRAYEKNFQDFLVNGSNAFKTGKFTLKSGRESPYFINMGEMFSSGEYLKRLGGLYANAIADKVGIGNFEVIVSPADKGTPLSTTVSMGLFDIYDVNTKVTFDRKGKKTHGEGTNKNFQTSQFFGYGLEGDEVCLMIDDVLTSGKTKYNLFESLKEVSDDFEFAGLLIAVDRQETYNGKDSVEEFTKTTGIPVYSITTATNIFKSLNEQKLLSKEKLSGFKDYMNKYGTNKAKEEIKEMELY